MPAAAIELELAALWREVARETPISRALLGNLIVAHPTAVDMSDLLEVGRRHPVRIILIESSGTQSESAAGNVRVSVIPFGSTTERYGIEAIAIDTASAELSIGSVIGRLVRGDVPTTVWWADDLSKGSLPTALFDHVRQIIYDSALWEDVSAGVRHLTEIVRASGPLDMADLNWQRLEPLRHAIIHGMTEHPPPEELRTEDVRITYRTENLAAARLTEGWLRCRLGWTDAVLTSTLVVSDDSAALTVTFAQARWRLDASLGERGASVMTQARPAAMIPVPPPNLAASVVAELRDLGHDACLRETVFALAGHN